MKIPDDLTDKRPGPNSAGQSGDDMGLPNDETESSESVAELVQEGQFYEAEALAGAARPYPDDKPVKTREVPEDDVPTEYPPRDPALDNE